MGDYVVHGTAADGQVLAFACLTRDTVEEARRRHHLTPLASAALGRAMSAAAMMASELKSEKETVSIQIQGNGPIKGVFVTADGAGHLRGYVGDPHVDLPRNSKGQLDVGGAIGIGVLSIVKDMGLKEPYVGSTHLVTSEIAEDLAYYFAESEQIPTADGLSVLVRRDGHIWTSGGFLIQLMPGASDEMADKLQTRVEQFPKLTTYLAEGHKPEEILESLLEGLDFTPMGREEICFQCDCNRDKVRQALISVGPKELQSLIDEGKPVQMTCHYCNQDYEFSVDEMKTLLAGMKPAGSAPEAPSGPSQEAPGACEEEPGEEPGPKEVPSD